MARRSLHSSPEGIIQAKQAITRKGWTQAYLAEIVGLSSRQSIWKFLTGRPIEKQVFKEICFRLDLDWEEISDFTEEEIKEIRDSTPKLVEETLGVEGCVKIMHSHLKEQIIAQCNTLESSFNLTQPPLNKVYIDLKVLTQPIHQRWLELSDLPESFSHVRRARINHQHSQAVEGLNLVTKHHKLMILGQPGAGKTTFVKQIALLCNRGQYEQDLVPCFIQLRSWLMNCSDQGIDLLAYFMNQVKNSGLSKQQGMMLLNEGKCLFLLDGLDEVSQQERVDLARNIDDFAQEFYKNKIIITCRPALQTFHFQGFIYVEMACFDRLQIEEFAKGWFVATAKDKKTGKSQAEQFIQELEKADNQPLLELGITPILLNLMCSVFQEKSSLPNQRYKVYQAGLDILLQRWDQSKGIERDSFDKNLPLAHKMKLLCQIAAITFEEERYFFESRYILGIIEEYMQENLTIDFDVEDLWLAREEILKSLEANHGLLIEQAKDIYSFSHLTFHEYLTARKIVMTTPKLLESELTKLASNLFEIRWREVTLLVASMLPKADILIRKMKLIIDSLVQEDLKLQKFLAILENKVVSLKLELDDAATRAFYFTLFFARDLNLALSLDKKFGNMNQIAKEINLDNLLCRSFMNSKNLVKNPDLKKIINLYFSLAIEDKFELETYFKNAFEQLKEKLPNLDLGQENTLEWWKTQGKKWVNEFRDLLIEYRQIGYDWELSQEERKKWQNYYEANLFLVQCLQGNCEVSIKVKQEIKSTILKVSPTE